eukprot:scpid43784/ scgid17100/ 
MAAETTNCSQQPVQPAKSDDMSCQQQMTTANRTSFPVICQRSVRVAHGWQPHNSEMTSPRKYAHKFCRCSSDAYSYTTSTRLQPRARGGMARSPFAFAAFWFEFNYFQSAIGLPTCNLSPAG